MDRIEHLFTILGEEGAEITQRTSKVNRFGIKEVQPGQEKTNAQRVVEEYADVLAVAEMLQDEGVIELTGIGKLMDAKKIKVEKFLEYSAKQGTLTESRRPTSRGGRDG